MNIIRDRIKKPIDLKCDNASLKEIVIQVIESNFDTPFPACNLKHPLTSKLFENNQFCEYQANLYEPELSKKDLIRISKILSELITSGYLSINFFDRYYSSSDIELFKI